MIKPTELRIGNYVEYDNNGTPVRVKMLSASNIYYNESCYSPFTTMNAIPLTEEWLVNFGFIKNRKKETKECEYIKALPYDLLYITIDLGENYKVVVDDKELPVAPYISLGYFSEGYKMHNAKEVHTLQNLYFALTGKELTIDKTT